MASILIVDDDSSIRTLLKRLLCSQGGHKTTEAENGAKAVELIEESNFDLVISDLRMPDVHGLALLELIKKRAPTIPVILVTAYGSPESTVEAVKLGVFDYLAKPFKMDEILSVVRRALDSREGKSRATDGYAGNNQVILEYLAKEKKPRDRVRRSADAGCVSQRSAS